MALTAVPRVAHKGITTIQEGSVYKERFYLATALPSDTTVRMEFRDSSGAVLAELDSGVVNGHYVEIEESYSEVEFVPNGAGFYCYVTPPSSGEEHMIKYGTVFRRQLTFPDSPATLATNVPKQYEDSFQRPPGSPGGRWKFLVGQPRIVESGNPLLRLLSFLFTHYSAYFMRYYVPFAGDTITLTVSATKKGSGKTIIALACSSDGSSYVYVMLDGTNNKIDIGRGLGPDISVGGNLVSEITPVNHTIPGSNTLEQFKIRYDDITKTIGVYNSDYTTEYASWTDSGNEAPHGKGYRYFAIAGTSNADNSGIQVAYIKAQDDV